MQWNYDMHVAENVMLSVRFYYWNSRSCTFLVSLWNRTGFFLNSRLYKIIHLCFLAYLSREMWSRCNVKYPVWYTYTVRKLTEINNSRLLWVHYVFAFYAWCNWFAFIYIYVFYAVIRFVVKSDNNFRHIVGRKGQNISTKSSYVDIHVPNLTFRYNNEPPVILTMVKPKNTFTATVYYVSA